VWSSELYCTPEVPEPAAVAETIREAKPLRMSAHSCVVSALVVGATSLVDAFGVPAAVSLDVVAGATVEEVAEAAEEVAGAAEPVSVVETTGAFDVVASEDGDVVSAFATGTSVIVPATAAASESPAMRLTLEFEAIITSRM